jgi:catechol 2,3-dioxygenase-like lactoylglutathione lyase family enzyme
MTMKYAGLSHIAIRVSDLDKARAFYVDILGFQPIRQSDHHFLANVHGSLIGFIKPDQNMPVGDSFSPFRIGLDHVALGVPNRKALESLKVALDSAGVRNNGIQHDQGEQTDYIAFYDPDGIAWEFFIMPLPVRIALGLSRLIGLKIPMRG